MYVSSDISPNTLLYKSKRFQPLLSFQVSSSHLTCIKRCCIIAMVYSRCRARHSAYFSVFKFIKLITCHTLEIFGRCSEKSGWRDTI